MLGEENHRKRPRESQNLIANSNNGLVLKDAHVEASML